MAKQPNFHDDGLNFGTARRGDHAWSCASKKGASIERTEMPKRSIAERLAQLEAQRKTLQAKLGKQERARDTRRKVLLGAFVLYRLEKGQDEFSRHLGDWLRKELPGFLTREDDQALFDDLLQPSAAGKPENAAAGA